MNDFEEYFLEQFEAEEIKLQKHKNNERVILRTPSIDYCFSKEGWLKFKEKINKV